ncbi:MAG: hypothetical protein CEE41_05315 [Hadesarchaea archaeon B3_Hades]|nr:MAG: hypothetical protein CEE41_05315 [Hadesarchaea archaeon B3_Hades]
MSIEYVRKLQDHGTGKEIRVPPEVCEKLGINGGDDVSFDLDLNNDVVILTKQGTQANRKPEQQIKAVALEQGQQKVISLIDTEKTITLNFSELGCIISGKPGCGKMNYAEKLCRSRKRLIVYDTSGKYTEGIVTEDLQKFENFWARVQHGNFRIIYRPLNPEQDFDSVCELVNQYKPLTFLVDNLDRYCEPPVSEQFNELIQNVHNHEIELIATTQRPQKIAELLNSQAEQGYQLIALPAESSPNADIT